MSTLAGGDRTARAHLGSVETVDINRGGLPVLPAGYQSPRASWVLVEETWHYHMFHADGSHELYY